MIYINSHNTVKKQKNFWNNIHFHPTDAIEDDWGRKILDEVKKDNVADTVRMYAMLEDIVTADDNGNLHYDFTLNDQRLDYMVKNGFNIFLSYNFIPPCIAENPEETSNVTKNATRYKGKMIVTSPPKDYILWEEICFKYTEHIVSRYGADEVSKWYLQCYNEPDIDAFFMRSRPSDDENTMLRATEYIKLYRHFTRGVKKACPTLKVGGPALAYKLDFLEYFLKKVKEEGLPFDFFCGHTYGTNPKELNSGEKPFHARNTLEKHTKYSKLVEKYFGADTKIIIDEWGASSAGFYNRDECPLLMFREDSRYSAYFGKMITGYINENVNISKLLICLSGQHEMVTDFSGFRNFFTLNFIKKPIYNAYILARKLHENILETKTDCSDMDILATSDKDNLSIMLSYASENFDKDLPDVADRIEIEGISGEKHITVWCIDENHTNPYTLSQRKNMGDTFTTAQLAKLREEGCLKPLSKYDAKADGKLYIDIEFTNNALVLIEVKSIEQ